MQGRRGTVQPLPADPQDLPLTLAHAPSTCPPPQRQRLQRGDAHSPQPQQLSHLAAAAGSAPPAHGEGWARGEASAAALLDPPAPRAGWDFPCRETPCTTANALAILLGFVTSYMTFGALYFEDDIDHYAILPADTHIHLGNECSENIFLYGHWSPNPPCSDYCVSFQTTQQDFKM